MLFILVVVVVTTTVTNILDFIKLEIKKFDQMIILPLYMKKDFSLNKMEKFFYEKYLHYKGNKKSSSFPSYSYKTSVY